MGNPAGTLKGLKAAFGGAVAIAAVSTLGDFIWATWIPQHRVPYGLTHGTLLFLCVGLFLGELAHKPLSGALGGALIGFAAAGSFYLFAGLAGRWAMFAAWFGLWIALGLFNERLARGTRMGNAMARGVIAALASGVAFYLVSGIWRPFNPQGWDYLVHFGAWMVAYLPGFTALLMGRLQVNMVTAGA
jgi:hypothetical protein